MIGPWLNMSLLALESQQVVALRLARLAGGGTTAWREAQLMVLEKLEAGHAAAGRLAGGATTDSVVDDYRRTVQANARRLSHPS
ncbi:hypothetical protein [Enterovirga rhinocerotis]|uniref:Uncharacterized protein n=1 Tax=Enterovirga rhinocerotis TaxID=1339210 RepID=A0A4R7BJ03_9HYPH|nr:hypothetical protein [Enterovirga rhinocerotis]TDR85304.1 hypothetical protein EV668_4859 [Enterovirga rhinocerotis]